MRHLVLPPVCPIRELNLAVRADSGPEGANGGPLKQRGCSTNLQPSIHESLDISRPILYFSGPIRNHSRPRDRTLQNCPACRSGPLVAR